MVWNAETIQLLKDLWAQGHSTAEIGRRLDISKNAVVGKAHRLELTARPSPIRRDGPDKTAERLAEAFRPDRPTLPPLASAAEALISAPPRIAASQPLSNVQPMRAAPVVRPVPPPPPPVMARVAEPPIRVAPAPPASAPQRRAAPSCCWPIGEPGKKDFRFCDDLSLAGKPYCEAHARLAYVKIRDRKEDAA
jgi:GcrA cell cycle regulator